MNIPNIIINDTRLKLQDVGLLALLRYHDIKYFSEYKLIQLIPTHGRTSLRSALKRLEHCGYLSRIQHHDENGRLSQCEWIISYRTKQTPNKNIPSTLQGNIHY